MRERLRSLSWFMKCLKEPLSRLANREEQTRGAFFEGRFKSVAILDEESLLATCAYIDLNPVAAGIAEVPEASAHTSIKQRVEHVKEQGRTEDLNAAQAGSVAGSTAAVGLEEGLWLCPVEDRRRLDSSREGMIEGFSLGNYLLLVEYTGRLFRAGKAVISAELAGVFERLGSNAESWQARLQKLAASRLLGRFFAASRARLRESRRASGRAPPGELGRLRGALTPTPRLDSKLVSISLFRRRSEESGDLVVNYVYRDRSDHPCQFGMRSKPACRPGRRAVRGWMLIVTRKPGRPTCGLRKACRSVG